ncbi:hypothetical protein VNO77_26928 [Canavalia gladiata]|uniref:Uncharacterized protein n=1 Tax=Canavalia gladiata TaxID=3824 RepID=A0AAN9KT81_CANGL
MGTPDSIVLTQPLPLPFLNSGGCGEEITSGLRRYLLLKASSGYDHRAVAHALSPRGAPCMARSNEVLPTLFPLLPLTPASPK